MNKNIKIFDFYNKKFNTFFGKFPVYIPTGEINCNIEEVISNQVQDLESKLAENVNSATVSQSPDDTLLLVDAELQSILDTFYLEN
jgi:hypothetical protein